MIMLIILSSCGDSDSYRFSGSSENWEVFYEVDVLVGDRQEKRGTVKFIGREEAPPKIDYELKSSYGGSKGTEVALEDGVGNIGNTSCEGCALIQKDEEISVEITWDGHTENLLLTIDE